MAENQEFAMEELFNNPAKEFIVQSLFGGLIWPEGTPDEEKDLYAVEKDKQGWMRSLSLPGDEPYTFGPDSLPQEGVPKGTIVDGEMVSSIYPESKHVYKIYVPAQYDPSKETPLMLFLDGVSMFATEQINAIHVLDNLIAAGKIPVMLGVFVDPGDHGEGMLNYGAVSQPGTNRAREYDAIDDTFARFIDEEILPLVAKDYNITSDPEGRGVAGGSSGGNGAFCLAWHHPNSFRKVLSYVGSFVNDLDDMMGGNLVPTMIRATPKKPLRVLLQDGKRDLNVRNGNWYLANLQMASALEYRGYDYQYILGEGGHSMFHAAQIFPENMIWLWRDYEK